MDEDVSPILRQIMGAQGPRRGTGASSTAEDPDYVAFAHGRVGNRPQQMLAFRLPSGEVFALPYMSLVGAQSPNVEECFTLDFGTTRVTVSGKNLGRLWRYVLEGRAAEIVAADRGDVFGTDPAAAVVTGIVRAGL